MLFANRHWMIMFIAGITALTFIIVRCGTLVYYCKYYLGMDEKQTSTFLVLGNVGFIAGAVTTRFVVKAMGKKWAFITTQVALAATCAAFYWIGPNLTGMINTMQVLNGIAGGMNATLYWAMIADTADFAEWKFGVRTTGIVFSATTCSQKVGMGIGGAVSGVLLTNFGYVAGAVQTAHANHGILLLVSLIPAAGFLCIGAVFCLYGLNERVCHTMREELATRRQQQAAEPALAV
jgi:glycoside/pentoside/hexuronide:cation symporter, GPH family